MPSRLILRIQEKQTRLTESEKKIAQVLSQNQQLVETHTATEVAKLAGVSKATTARFFRTLGYADFEEVRLQARDERNRLQPYVRGATQAEASKPSRSISDHLDLELANLTRTFEELRSDILPQIAQAITEAPRVWVLGFGLEDGLARTGAAMLSRLRHNVHHLSGVGQNWAGDLGLMGPRDVLLLLSLEPRPRILPAILSHARTSRVRTITLADHAFQAQATRFSEIVVPCHVSSLGMIPTHTTLLSMLRLIGVAYVSENPKVAEQRIDLLQTIEEELGLFE